LWRDLSAHDVPPPVQEFGADKGFEDGKLVSENKVIWFLNDRVLA
jgi:hypothetical protein